MASLITPEQLAKSGSEKGEQSALFAQAALHFKEYPQLKWMHAIPNANSHHMIAEGCRAGVSDVFLPYAVPSKDSHGFPEGFNYGYHGLYIEMKIEKRRNQKNGGLSQEQVDFMTYATCAGYKCVVCYSWQEGWNEIVKYLNGE